MMSNLHAKAARVGLVVDRTKAAQAELAAATARLQALMREMIAETQKGRDRPT